MSKQKHVKRLVTGMAAALVICGGCITSAQAASEVASEPVVSAAAIGGSENLAQPYKTQYQWYFKEIKGYMFRRLYDTTNGKWVTPWILIP